MNHFDNHPTTDQPERTRRLKSLLIDRLISLALQPETSQQQVAQAEVLQALQDTVDPFTRLEQAAQLSEQLPDEAINPIIDSTSHDTLDQLRIQEHEAAKKAYGIALGTGQIESTIDAWEVARSQETRDLALFAIEHAGSKGATITLQAAFEKVESQKGMSFAKARDIVNREHLATRVPSHQVEYPWLYDRSVDKPAA